MTCTPGYHVKATATSDGIVSNLTLTADGQHFTFTMPNSDVDVIVTFEWHIEPTVRSVSGQNPCCAINTVNGDFYIITRNLCDIYIDPVIGR
mgnify:CR=1 FL=1